MRTSLQIGRSMVTRVALGLILAVVGCATTDMTSTWTDPSAKGASLSKVAVIALAKDPGLRRMAEDSAVQQLVGAQAVPSYQVLGDMDLKDREAVKAKLHEQGFQGVLVMRIEVNGSCMLVGRSMVGVSVPSIQRSGPGLSFRPTVP